MGEPRCGLRVAPALTVAFPPAPLEKDPQRTRRHPRTRRRLTPTARASAHEDGLPVPRELETAVEHEALRDDDLAVVLAALVADPVAEVAREEAPLVPHAEPPRRVHKRLMLLLGPLTLRLRLAGPHVAVEVGVGVLAQHRRRVGLGCAPAPRQEMLREALLVDLEGELAAPVLFPRLFRRRGDPKLLTDLRADPSLERAIGLDAICRFSLEAQVL
eukprot:CAMPEP_0177609092 /NCGR_PEP_ID=MMETSP0419_2-20121207/18874_1 /TAXON_ID=582737 /ORGANISM="Tetraselmis sp., Strain GSL018" /LENGTH=215 /DNA_ID=CAMNT_0019103933 /DNA_START=217 /DNA_END=862 /DNA_ORIENTATION=-